MVRRKHTVFGAVVSGQEVVDSIVQNDVINKVTIIRKGSEAKKFDAPKVFSDYFNEKEQRRAEQEEKLAVGKLMTLEKLIHKERMQQLLLLVYSI